MRLIAFMLVLGFLRACLGLAPLLVSLWLQSGLRFLCLFGLLRLLLLLLLRCGLGLRAARKGAGRGLRQVNGSNLEERQGRTAFTGLRSRSTVGGMVLTISETACFRVSDWRRERYRGCKGRDSKD